MRKGINSLIGVMEKKLAKVKKNQQKMGIYIVEGLPTEGWKLKSFKLSPLIEIPV